MKHYNIREHLFTIYVICVRWCFLNNDLF